MCWQHQWLERCNIYISLSIIKIICLRITPLQPHRADAGAGTSPGRCQKQVESHTTPRLKSVHRNHTLMPVWCCGFYLFLFKFIPDTSSQFIYGCDGSVPRMSLPPCCRHCWARRPATAAPPAASRTPVAVSRMPLGAGATRRGRRRLCDDRCVMVPGLRVTHRPTPRSDRSARSRDCSNQPDASRQGSRASCRAAGAAVSCTARETWRTRTQTPIWRKPRRVPVARLANASRQSSATQERCRFGMPGPAEAVHGERTAALRQTQEGAAPCTRRCSRRRSACRRSPK